MSVLETLFIGLELDYGKFESSLQRQKLNARTTGQSIENSLNIKTPDIKKLVPEVDTSQIRGLHQLNSKTTESTRKANQEIINSTASSTSKLGAELSKQGQMLQGFRAKVRQALNDATKTPNIPVIYPQVDFSQLHELNRLYYLKEADHNKLIIAVTKPITPVVDSSQLEKALSLYNQLVIKGGISQNASVRATVSSEIQSTVKTKIESSDFIKQFEDEGKKLAEKIGKEVGKAVNKNGGLFGTIGKIISAPVATVSAGVRSITKGALEGAGQSFERLAIKQIDNSIPELKILQKKALEALSGGIRSRFIEEVNTIKALASSEDISPVIASGLAKTLQAIAKSGINLSEFDVIPGVQAQVKNVSKTLSDEVDQRLEAIDEIRSRVDQAESSLIAGFGTADTQKILTKLVSLKSRASGTQSEEDVNKFVEATLKQLDSIGEDRLGVELHEAFLNKIVQTQKLLKGISINDSALEGVSTVLASLVDNEVKGIQSAVSDTISLIETSANDVTDKIERQASKRENKKSLESKRKDALLSTRDDLTRLVKRLESTYIALAKFKEFARSPELNNKDLQALVEQREKDLVELSIIESNLKRPSQIYSLSEQSSLKAEYDRLSEAIIDSGTKIDELTSSPNEELRTLVQAKIEALTTEVDDLRSKIESTKKFGESITKKVNPLVLKAAAQAGLPLEDIPDFDDFNKAAKDQIAEFASGVYSVIENKVLLNKELLGQLNNLNGTAELFELLDHELEHAVTTLQNPDTIFSGSLDGTLSVDTLKKFVNLPKSIRDSILERIDLYSDHVEDEINAYTRQYNDLAFHDVLSASPDTIHERLRNLSNNVDRLSSLTATETSSKASDDKLTVATKVASVNTSSIFNVDSTDVNADLVVLGDIKKDFGDISDPWADVADEIESVYQSVEQLNSVSAVTDVVNATEEAVQKIQDRFELVSESITDNTVLPELEFNQDLADQQALDFEKAITEWDAQRGELLEVASESFEQQAKKLAELEATISTDHNEAYVYPTRKHESSSNEIVNVDAIKAPDSDKDYSAITLRENTSIAQKSVNAAQDLANQGIAMAREVIDPIIEKAQQAVNSAIEPIVARATPIVERANRDIAIVKTAVSPVVTPVANALSPVVDKIATEIKQTILEAYNERAVISKDGTIDTSRIASSVEDVDFHQIARILVEDIQTTGQLSLDNAKKVASQLARIPGAEQVGNLGIEFLGAIGGAVNGLKQLESGLFDIVGVLKPIKGFLKTFVLPKLVLEGAKLAFPAISPGITAAEHFVGQQASHLLPQAASAVTGVIGETGLHGLQAATVGALGSAAVATVEATAERIGETVAERALVGAAEKAVDLTLEGAAEAKKNKNLNAQIEAKVVDLTQTQPRRINSTEQAQQAVKQRYSEYNNAVTSFKSGDLQKASYLASNLKESIKAAEAEIDSLIKEALAVADKQLVTDLRTIKGQLKSNIERLSSQLLAKIAVQQDALSSFTVDTTATTSQYDAAVQERTVAAKNARTDLQSPISDADNPQDHKAALKAEYAKIQKAFETNGIKAGEDAAVEFGILANSYIAGVRKNKAKLQQSGASSPEIDAYIKQLDELSRYAGQLKANAIKKTGVEIPRLSLSTNAPSNALSGLIDQLADNVGRLIKSASDSVESLKEQVKNEGVVGAVKYAASNPLVRDLAVNTAGFAASQVAGDHGIVAGLAGDLGGALAARQAINALIAVYQAYQHVLADIGDTGLDSASKLEQLQKVVQKTGEILNSPDFQKEVGGELFGDVTGFGIGNAAAIGLSAAGVHVPLQGAVAAMATVPQLAKIRNSFIGKEEGVSEGVNVGRNIVAGASEGILNASADAEASVDKVCRDIINQTEDTLEIQSPSKVFFRIGKNIVAGLGLGLSDASELKTKLHSLFDALKVTPDQYNQIQSIVDKILENSNINQESIEIDLAETLASPTEANQQASLLLNASQDLPENALESKIQRHVQNRKQILDLLFQQDALGNKLEETSIKAIEAMNTGLDQTGTLFEPMLKSIGNSLKTVNAQLKSLLAEFSDPALLQAGISDALTLEESGRALFHRYGEVQHLQEAIENGTRSPEGVRAINLEDHGDEDIFYANVSNPNAPRKGLPEFGRVGVRLDPTPEISQNLTYTPGEFHTTDERQQSEIPFLSPNDGFPIDLERQYKGGIIEAQLRGNNDIKSAIKEIIYDFSGATGSESKESVDNRSINQIKELTQIAEQLNVPLSIGSPQKGFEVYPPEVLHDDDALSQLVEYLRESKDSSKSVFQGADSEDTVFPISNVDTSLLQQDSIHQDSLNSALDNIESVVAQHQVAIEKSIELAEVPQESKKSGSTRFNPSTGSFEIVDDEFQGLYHTATSARNSLDIFDGRPNYSARDISNLDSTQQERKSGATTFNPVANNFELTNNEQDYYSQNASRATLNTFSSQPRYNPRDISNFYKQRSLLEENISQPPLPDPFTTPTIAVPEPVAVSRRNGVEVPVQPLALESSGARKINQLIASFSDSVSESAELILRNSEEIQNRIIAEALQYEAQVPELPTTEPTPRKDLIENGLEESLTPTSIIKSILSPLLHNLAEIEQNRLEVAQQQAQLEAERIQETRAILNNSPKLSEQDAITRATEIEANLADNPSSRKLSEPYVSPIADPEFAGQIRQLEIENNVKQAQEQIEAFWNRFSDGVRNLASSSVDKVRAVIDQLSPFEQVTVTLQDQINNVAELVGSLQQQSSAELSDLLSNLPTDSAELEAKFAQIFSRIDKIVTAIDAAVPGERDAATQIAALTEEFNQKAEAVIRAEGENSVESVQLLFDELQQKIKQIESSAASANTTTTTQLRVPPILANFNQPRQPQRAQDLIAVSGINFLDNLKQSLDSLIQRIPLLKGVTNLIKDIGSALFIGGVGLFLGNALSQFARDSFTAAREAERLKIALDFATIDGSTKVLSDIRAETNLLGTSFQAAAEARKNLEAASIGSSLQPQIKGIVSGFQQRFSAQQLDPGSQGRVLTQVGQIIGKSKIQSEEILTASENLPGFLQAIAKSLGLTTEETLKAAQAGNLLADDVLPKLANQLSLESETGAANAAQSANAELTRLDNNLLQLKQSAGNLPLGAVGFALKGINPLLKALADNMEAATTVITIAAASLSGQLIFQLLKYLKVLPIGTTLTQGFTIAVKGLISVLGTLALQALAVGALTAAWEELKFVTGNASSAEKDFAEQSIKNLDRLIEKQKEFNKQKGLGSLELEKNKTPLRSEGIPGFLDDIQGFILNGVLRGNDFVNKLVDDFSAGISGTKPKSGRSQINNPDRGEEFGGPNSIIAGEQIAERLQKAIEAINDQLSGKDTFKGLRVPTGSARESTIKQLQAFDQQAAQLRVERSVASLAGKPQNELAAIDKQIADITIKRQKVSNESIGNSQQALLELQKNIKAQIESLEGKGNFPGKQIAVDELNKQLLVTEGRLKEIDQINVDITERTQALAPELIRVSTALEGGKIDFDNRAVTERTEQLKLQKNLLLDNASISNETLTRERETAELNIQRLKIARSSYEDIFNKLKEVDKVALRTALGGTDVSQASRAQVSQVQQLEQAGLIKGLSGDAEKALETRIKILDITNEQTQAQEQLAQAQLNERKNIDSLSVAISRLQSAYEGIQIVSDRARATFNRNLAIQKASLSVGDIGSQEQSARRDIEDSKKIIAQITASRKQYIAEINKFTGKDRQELEKAAGKKLEQLDTNDISRLNRDFPLSANQKKVLEAQQQVITSQDRITQAQQASADASLTLTNLARSTYRNAQGLSRNLDDFRKSVDDFYLGLRKQIRDAITQYNKTLLDIQGLQTQQAFAGFQSGGTADLFAPLFGFIQDIQNQSDQLEQQKLDLVNVPLDIAEQQRNLAFQTRDLNRQFEDLSLELNLFKESLRGVSKGLLQNNVVKFDRAPINPDNLKIKSAKDLGIGGPTNDTPNIYNPDSAIAAINRTADALGVTAEDIATIVQAESSFRNIRGGSGNAYAGYFQFGKGALQDLEDRGVAKKGTNGLNYSFNEQLELFKQYVLLRGYEPGSGVRPLYNTLNLGSPGAGGVDGFGTPGGRTSKLNSDSPEREAARRVLNRLASTGEQIGSNPLAPRSIPVPTGLPTPNFANQFQPQYQQPVNPNEIRGLFGRQDNVIVLPNASASVLQSIGVFGGINLPGAQQQTALDTQSRPPLPGEVGGLFGDPRNRIALPGGITPSVAQSLSVFGGVGSLLSQSQVPSAPRNPLPGEVSGLFGDPRNTIALPGGLSPSVAQSIQAFGGLNNQPPAQQPSSQPIPVQITNLPQLPPLPDQRQQLPQLPPLPIGSGGGVANNILPVPSLPNFGKTSGGLSSLPPAPSSVPPGNNFAEPLPTLEDLQLQQQSVELHGKARDYIDQIGALSIKNNELAKERLRIQGNLNNAQNQQRLADLTRQQTRAFQDLNDEINKYGVQVRQLNQQYRLPGFTGQLQDQIDSVRGSYFDLFKTLTRKQEDLQLNLNAANAFNAGNISEFIRLTGIPAEYASQAGEALLKQAPEIESAIKRIREQISSLSPDQAQDYVTRQFTQQSLGDVNRARQGIRQEGYQNQISRLNRRRDVYGAAEVQTRASLDSLNSDFAGNTIGLTETLAKLPGLSEEARKALEDLRLAALDLDFAPGEFEQFLRQIPADSQASIEAINLLTEAQANYQGKQTEAIAGQQTFFGDLTKGAEDAAGSAFQNLFSNFGDFVTGVKSADEVVREFFVTFLQGLAQVATQLVTQQILKALVGAIGGAAGGVGAGAPAIGLGGFGGLGGLFNTGGTVPSYVSGGSIGNFSVPNYAGGGGIGAAFGSSGGGVLQLLAGLFGGGGDSGNNEGGGFASILKSLLGPGLKALLGGVGVFSNGGMIGNYAEGGEINDLGKDITIGNYASGTMGGLSPATGLGVAVLQAMQRERAAGGNPVPVVASTGEEILSMKNGDAQAYRRLRSSGEWNNIKVGNYADGTSSDNNGSRSGRGSRANSIIINENIYLNDASGVRQTEFQRRQKDATLSRRALERL